MFGGSNYPPGVTGNEPQITGEWPAEELVDEVVAELDWMVNKLDDMGALLDDNKLYESVEDAYQAVERAIDVLRSDLLNLVAEAE